MKVLYVHEGRFFSAGLIHRRGDVCRIFVHAWRQVVHVHASAVFRPLAWRSEWRAALWSAVDGVSAALLWLGGTVSKPARVLDGRNGPGARPPSDDEGGMFAHAAAISGQPVTPGKPEWEAGRSGGPVRAGEVRVAGEA